MNSNNSIYLVNANNIFFSLKHALDSGIVQNIYTMNFYKFV